MDWKREAIDKLRCYEAKKSSIQRAEEEIARLEAELTHIRVMNTEVTTVSGGSINSDGAIINNMANRAELKRALNETKGWIKIVDSGLSVLDKEERLVLERFYIHKSKGNVDRLCEELCVEQATAYRRRDNALRHFTLALYGVTDT